MKRSGIADGARSVRDDGIALCPLYERSLVCLGNPVEGERDSGLKLNAIPL